MQLPPSPPEPLAPEAAPDPQTPEASGAAPRRLRLPAIDWRTKLRWFAAEIVIVVAGVLIALGANAAWQRQQQDDLEAAVLRSVAAELGANRASLVGLLAYTDGCLATSDRFLRSGPAALAAVPRDSVSGWVERLGCPATFDPTLAASGALSGAGGVSAVRDLGPREAVAGWITALDDAEEEADMLRSAGLAVINAATPYAAGGTASGLPGFPTIPRMIAAAPPGALADLRADERFVQAVIVRSHQQHLYADELRAALVRGDSARAVIGRALPPSP